MEYICFLLSAEEQTFLNLHHKVNTFIMKYEMMCIQTCTLF